MHELAWIAPFADWLEEAGFQARRVKQIIDRVGEASRCLLLFSGLGTRLL
jgi:hypothetical protein